MLCMLVLNADMMQAHTPPSSWYQSPLVAETEQQRVWLNSWQVCVPAMSVLLSCTVYQGWHAAAADWLSALSCPRGHLQCLSPAVFATSLSRAGGVRQLRHHALFWGAAAVLQGPAKQSERLPQCEPCLLQELAPAVLCPACTNTDSPDSSLIWLGLVHAQVCSHHAAEVASGEGRTDVFVCPYHNWTYGEACMQALEGRPASQMPGCHAGPGAGAPLPLPP